MVGTVIIVKLKAADVPPPGAGVTTVTLAVPAAAKSVAVILAASWVLLLNVVLRGCPFHCTEEVAMKFDPFRVNVKAALPGAALEGVIELNTGTSLLIAAPTVNGTGLDTPPAGAGLITVIGTSRETNISLAEMVAVNPELLA